MRPATQPTGGLGARGNALTANPTTSENTGGFPCSALERGGVMKELLERWRAVEPSRFRLDPDGDYSVFLSGFWWGFPPGVGIVDAHVQQGVQEAIEARGWMGAVGFGGARGADAMVLKTEGADGADANGSTPAEALLSAYLTALEAQG
jgi:hypothetical protein